MTLALDTMPRKLGLVCAVALATAGLSLPLWSHFRAASYSQIGTQQNLERALELQPRNAELHNRLGRLLLYTPLGDAAHSLRALELATQLDPRSGQFWSDLALAHEVQGNFGAAAHALAKARAAEPNTPAILWHEANYLVRRGAEAQALDRLKLLLAQAPEYTVRALAFFARVAEPSVLLEQAVPRRRDALEAAIEFVRREQLLGTAPALWRAVQTLQEAPSEGQLRMFVDWLITAQQVSLAGDVWNESARRGWLPVQPVQDAAELYNAGFERPLQNFGFDWRVVAHPEATAWIEARGPAAGMQSLCIQFASEARGAYAHVMHAVAVEPNSTYALKAALRSDRLASRAGAMLGITTFDNVELARTDSVTGTSHWKEVATVLQSGPQAKFVLLRLMRPAPAKDDEAAPGLACVADIRWSKLGPSSGNGGLRP